MERGINLSELQFSCRTIILAIADIQKFALCAHCVHGIPIGLVWWMSMFR